MRTIRETLHLLTETQLLHYFSSWNKLTPSKQHALLVRVYTKYKDLEMAKKKHGGNGMYIRLSARLKGDAMMELAANDAMTHFYPDVRISTLVAEAVADEMAHIERTGRDTPASSTGGPGTEAKAQQPQRRTTTRPSTVSKYFFKRLIGRSIHSTTAIS